MRGNGAGRVQVHDFADGGAGLSALATIVSDSLELALEQRGGGVLAVAGGETPKTYLPLLAGLSLAWSKITLTLSDERWVPPSDPASNEGLVRGLISNHPAGAANFLPMWRDAITPNDACREFKAVLADAGGQIDLVLLGMGEDGHIASLFPYAAELNSDDPCCVVVPQSPTGHARISLSPGAIVSANRVVIVMSGANKRAIWEQSKAPGDVAALPVRLLHNRGTRPTDALFLP